MDNGRHSHVVNENILMALRQVAWNPTSFCIVALARYMTRQCGAVFLSRLVHDSQSRLATNKSWLKYTVSFFIFIFICGVQLFILY
jgi:hypothetical protein